MTGKTHKLGGLCFGVVAGAIFIEPPYSFDKLTLTIVLIIGALFGSLLPDIDHSGSTIGSKVKPISSMISNLFGHRGLTHAPLTYIVLTLVLLLIGENLSDFFKLMYTCFIIGIFIGSLSHILLDSMTTMGVPLFYPFSKKKQRIARFTTGKHELIVQIITIIITVIAFNIVI